MYYLRKGEKMDLRKEKSVVQNTKFPLNSNEQYSVLKWDDRKINISRQNT